MRSPFADSERERLIAAILPDVPFDGWSLRALRSAARRADIPFEEVTALFPRGAPDMVAAMSHWADRQMLQRLEAALLQAPGAEPPGLSRRVEMAIHIRFEIVLPWREAVRRGLSVLALPHNAPLVGVGLAQHGVQRGDHRHVQVAEQREDVRTRGAAVDAELVLQAHDVHVAEIEEVRDAAVVHVAAHAQEPEVGDVVLAARVEAAAALHVQPLRRRIELLFHDAEALAELPVKAAYLDGELCGVLRDGRTAFSIVQNAADSRSSGSLVFFLFDLLHLDGGT